MDKHQWVRQLWISLVYPVSLPCDNHVPILSNCCLLLAMHPPRPAGDGVSSLHEAWLRNRVEAAYANHPCYEGHVLSACNPPCTPGAIPNAPCCWVTWVDDSMTYCDGLHLARARAIAEWFLFLNLTSEGPADAARHHWVIWWVAHHLLDSAITTPAPGLHFIFWVSLPHPVVPSAGHLVPGLRRKSQLVSVPGGDPLFVPENHLPKLLSGFGPSSAALNYLSLVVFKLLANFLESASWVLHYREVYICGSLVYGVIHSALPGSILGFEVLMVFV